MQKANASPFSCADGNPLEDQTSYRTMTMYGRGQLDQPYVQDRTRQVSARILSTTYAQ